MLGFAGFAGIEKGSCKVDRTLNRHCSTFQPDACTDYFSTLQDSFMQREGLLGCVFFVCFPLTPRCAPAVFILSTLENFPAVMIPVYECNKWNALFFVAYVVIGAYFLLNLTLAVAYTEFKDLTLKKVSFLVTLLCIPGSCSPAC